MGLNVELPDAEAVKLAARGDANAFIVLVHRYRAPLIAYVHGKMRARDEAEDIAQDAFCKAWEHLPKLRNPAAFGGWLFQIANNAVITAARKPRVGLLEAEAADRPVEDSQDCSVEVHAAVGELSQEHQIVVSLRHFSGMSTEQVAAALGIPPGTVRSRLSRAYAELRGRLASEVED